jgi:hypothetical protein
MGTGASVTEDEKNLQETRPRNDSAAIDEWNMMKIDSAVKKKKAPNIIHNKEVSASSSSSRSQSTAAPKEMTSEQLQKIAMGQKGYKDEHRDYNTSALHQKQDVAWEEAVSPSVTDLKAEVKDAPSSSSGSKQSAVVHRPLQKPPPRRISNPGSIAGGIGSIGSPPIGQVSRAGRNPTNISHVRPIEGNNPKKKIVYAPSELPAASAAMQSAPPTRMIPDTAPSSSSGTNKIESSKQNIQNIGGSNSTQSKLNYPPQKEQSSEMSTRSDGNRYDRTTSPAPNRVPVQGQGVGVKSHDVNQLTGKGTHSVLANSPNMNAGMRTGPGVMGSNGPGVNRPNLDPNRRLQRPLPNGIPVGNSNITKSRSSDNSYITKSPDNSDMEDEKDVMIPPRPKNIPSLYLNSNMNTNMNTAPPTGLLPNGKRSLSPAPFPGPLSINTTISGIGTPTAQNTMMMSTAMSALNNMNMGKSSDSRDSNRINTVGRAPSNNSTYSTYSTGASTPTNYRIGTVVKPSTPATNVQYEVKETNDVKRNRVKLPPTMTHAKPTTGDWLKKRYIVNNYILLDTLGTGSYGEVRLCKDRTTDGLFAIKIISKEMLKKKKSGNSNETYFEDIRREIAIMKKLVHPNVLRLFEVLDDPNVNKMYLVLEFMKEGDLINVLKSRETSSAINSNGENNNNSSTPTTTSNVSSLSDLELWNIFRQVVAGIRYLHYQNVVHGDIKPQVVICI